MSRLGECGDMEPRAFGPGRLGPAYLDNILDRYVVSRKLHPHGNIDYTNCMEACVISCEISNIGVLIFKLMGFFFSQRETKNFNYW